MASRAGQRRQPHVVRPCWPAYHVHLLAAWCLGPACVLLYWPGLLCTIASCACWCLVGLCMSRRTQCGPKFTCTTAGVGVAFIVDIAICCSSRMPSMHRTLSCRDPAIPHHAVKALPVSSRYVARIITPALMKGQRCSGWLACLHCRECLLCMRVCVYRLPSM